MGLTLGGLSDVEHLLGSKKLATLGVDAGKVEPPSCNV